MCPLLGWIVLVSKVLRREQEGIWILEPAKFYLAVSSFSQLSLRWGINFHPYHTLLSFLEDSINIEWILSYLFLSTEHEFGHLFRFHLFHTQIHRHIYNVSVFKNYLCTVYLLYVTSSFSSSSSFFCISGLPSLSQVLTMSHYLLSSLLPPVSYLFLVLLSFSLLPPKMDTLNF